MRRRGICSGDLGRRAVGHCREGGWLQSPECHEGSAGGILLTATLHIIPLDVSFSWVKVEEIPYAGGIHDGYFADSYFMSEWQHGTRQGAGVWRIPEGDNQFLVDEAGFRCSLPQLDARGYVSEAGDNGWMAGTLAWNVPCGWASPNVQEDDEPAGIFARDERQAMTIDAEGGCEVRKHSNQVRRNVDDTVYLNGVKVK